MAAWGGRTYKVLDVHQAQSFDQDGQTPLDHRTGFIDDPGHHCPLLLRLATMNE